MPVGLHYLTGDFNYFFVYYFTVVNPVRNSSGALNPAGIILKSNPAVEQRDIISNGVNDRLNGVENACLPKM